MLEELKQLATLRRIKIVHDTRHDDFDRYLEEEIKNAENAITEVEKWIEDEYLKCKNLK